jgi:glutathione synthase/RimK-type ligase-like ATP-grasp enzyme
MILILTRQEDPHADLVEAGLRRRGLDVARFDHSLFPEGAELTLEVGADSTRTQLRWPSGTLDLDTVSAVWHRRPLPPAPHGEGFDAATLAYATEECRTVLEGVWQALDCFKLPSQKFVYRAAESKFGQLRTAMALGAELPPTLVTNSARELRQFYRDHRGRIISKLASGSFARSDVAAACFRYTEIVNARDLVHAHAVRHAPMIFQAYVDKRVELRITVVGERVFAAEIHSQETNHTRHDWRRYDHGHTPIVPHALPDNQREFCVSLVRRLGLHYGTIDMVLTPDGRYVFLEINPNGQYLWIEKQSGLPITEAVCDLLARESQRYLRVS